MGVLNLHFLKKKKISFENLTVVNGLITSNFFGKLRLFLIFFKIDLILKVIICWSRYSTELLCNKWKSRPLWRSNSFEDWKKFKILRAELSGERSQYSMLFNKKRYLSMYRFWINKFAFHTIVKVNYFFECAKLHGSHELWRFCR